MQQSDMPVCSKSTETTWNTRGIPSSLRPLAAKIRRHSVVMTHNARASHVGTSLSMVELLAVLYGRVLRVDPHQPDWAERDRFVLSKGHGCAAYYAVLAEVGFFPLQWLDTFYQNGSCLAGHATHTRHSALLR